MIKIGTVQVNNSFSGYYYLPYSIGLLECFVKKYLRNANQFQFYLPLFRRIRIHEAFEHLKKADIVLFSLYVWNEKYSLTLARLLKEYNDTILIVFGGPSVPDQAELFLNTHSFVDIAVHQEGERSILSILESYPSRDWKHISGISYLTPSGDFYYKQPQPRMRDITQIPSPYLEGFFEPLIAKYPDIKWLATWETNRGCPFACTYCDWGSATNSKVARMDESRIYQELNWFSKHKVEFIFCADANFGLLPRDIDISNYAAANKLKYGYPHVLSVQNTKNKRDRSYKVQKILVDAGLSKGVTLAMQSTNVQALKQIKRDNISLDDYKALQERFQKDGIPTYTEIILGLPGDTYNTFCTGVCDIIQSGQHNKIQFNNLSILPNAELAQQTDLYKIKTVSSPIVGMHGTIEDNESNNLIETQQLVIESYSMPQCDWVKSRTFASTVECLYFCPLLHIVFFICHFEFELPFFKLFTLFIKSDKTICPTIHAVIDILKSHATAITLGGPEFIYNKNWLSIYWPPGEYAFIYLVTNNLLNKFYSESYKLILDNFSNAVNKAILFDAVEVNKHLLNTPFQRKPEVNTSHNIMETYHLIKVGKHQKIKKQAETILINQDTDHYLDLHEWMKKIVWYGHRNGNYMINSEVLTFDIAGHY